MPGSAKWDELNDIARLSVTESSRDGTVQVTVAAFGVLTGLVLTERWHQQSPDLLGRAVFETIGPNDPPRNS